jgi:hypothetical protein
MHLLDTLGLLIGSSEFDDRSFMVIGEVEGRTIDVRWVEETKSEPGCVFEGD